MPNIILADDWGGSNYWYKMLPLCFTKPIAQLRIGYDTISEKWQHALGGTISYHSQAYLSSKYPTNLMDDNWLIKACYLPYNGLANQVGELGVNQALMDGDELVAIRFAGQQIPQTLEGFVTVPLTSEPFKIAEIWDLFQKNGIALNLDFLRYQRGNIAQIVPQNNTIIGNVNQLFVAYDAVVEGVTFNTKKGPIFIDSEAVVMEGAMLRGPLYIGANATIKMGAKIYGDTTIGPHCKVGGEIGNSIFQAYSNKGHDGYLGNSLIGEWCNLGADTNSSNLKNNYGNVSLWDYKNQQMQKQQLQFCGLIMGDYSKAGINTMFNTATCVGVSCNIFGGGFPQKHIPSFSWGGANGFENFRFDKALEAANNMMKRRDKALTEQDVEILQSINQLSYK